MPNNRIKTKVVHINTELAEEYENSIHEGECNCDEGELYGDPIHVWECEFVACLMGECNCESVALSLLEEDRIRYLEER